MHGALFLVGIQFGGKHIEVALSALDLIKEPFLLLLDLLAVLQQRQVFAHRLIHAHEGTLAGRQGLDGGKQGG